MIKRIEHLYKLYNNLFEYLPIIYSFYKEYIGKEKDILLSYLILPLTLNEDSRTKLLNTNVRSSLFTFCKESNHLIGLSDKVKQYEQITNDCIQYGIDNGVFQISEDLQITVNNQFDMKNPHLIKVNTNKTKAAEKLSYILKSYDIPTVYRYLGVVEL